jgi:excisionase family DNA binding protein
VSNEIWKTVQEVAETLQVAEDKILDFIHAGELPASNLALAKTGRPRWRISPSALETFLIARQAKPAPIRQQQTKRRTLNVLEVY